MIDQLELLWKLQTLETEARSLEESLDRMPRALEAARQEVAVRETELARRDKERQDLVKQRRDLEREVEGLEGKLRESATRQISARSNAELNAMKKEAEFLRNQKSDLETRVLLLFEAEEEFEPRIREAKGELERARGQAALRQKEIEEQAEGQKKSLAERRAEWEGVASALPSPIRSRFEQVVRAKGGVAVVPIQRGACGGCFNSLPPQLINEVRKAERLQVCESCGRILVWRGDSGEAGS